MNKIAISSISAIVAATVPGLAQSQGGFGPPELQIVEAGDNFYMIRNDGSGNINVFTSDDGVLLIDSKFAADYDSYMELLRTVTDQPVRYVINTHQHGDHTGGNAQLKALGPDIIATENARNGMAADMARPQMGRGQPPQGQPPSEQPDGLPTITFDDHMQLYFGDRVMDLYWFGRGHTDGDLVIHLPEEDMILTGDLFAGYDPSIRLIDYNAGGSLLEWIATLEKVLELEFETVIPGHSGPTDRAMLQGYLDENVRMINLIRDMHEAGSPPADIQTAVTMEFGNMSFVVLPGVANVIAELE